MSPALVRFVVMVGCALVALTACGSDRVSPPPAWAAYAESHGSDVLVVERRGRPTFVATSNGWEADEPHSLASGTKSFAGVAAIVAVEDGLLTFDERASDTLIEWRRDPRRSRITVRQLLSQSSGLDPDAGLPADDAYRAGLTAPAIHDPGTTFDYGPNHFNAFALLMQRKLRAQGAHTDMLDYLQSRVLGPIGVRSAQWSRDDRGHPLFASGAKISATDWVRFGRLVSQRGVWRGRRLVAARLVDQMLAPSRVNPRYGLGWWLAPGPEAEHASPIRGVPKDLVMAAGAGDQRLYVVPSLGLVVLRFGDDEDFEDRDFLTRLFASKARSSA